MIKVKFICPICKNAKEIAIPESVNSQKSHLLTVSIPKGMVCEHHFQAFIDKKYIVRGYQKVDIDLKQQLIEPEVIHHKEDEREIFELLTIERNAIKFSPKNINTSNEERLERGNKLNTKKKLSLKDIYNEFWEFIDNDNLLFADFIKIDERRKLNDRKNKHGKIKDFILNLENDSLVDNI